MCHGLNETVIDTYKIVYRMQMNSVYNILNSVYKHRGIRSIRILIKLISVINSSKHLLQAHALSNTMYST